MIEIDTRITVRTAQAADAPPPAAEVSGRLELPFELRQKSRLRAVLSSGEEVMLRRAGHAR